MHGQRWTLVYWFLYSEMEIDAECFNEIRAVIWIISFFGLQGKDLQQQINH